MNFNRKKGNAFEQRLCKLLSERGYWVHNLAQNASGQPFDVIAAKGGRCFAIDCKVCSADIFRLSRIEQNQALAMTRWRETGNGEGWFALELSNGDIAFISYLKLQSLSASYLMLNLSDILAHSWSFDKWVNFA